MKTLLLLVLVLLAGCVPIQTPPVPTPLSGDATPVIAVESAFGAELALLLKDVANPKAHVINGRTFTRGKLAGKEVVLFLSGGSIYNSALTTQTAFDYFNVDKLLFSGIAGGIDPALNIGDVVIGTQSAEYMEMLASRETDGVFEPPSWFESAQKPFEFFYPQNNFVTQKGGTPDEEKSLRWFPGDPGLIATAQAAAKDVKFKDCGVDKVGQPVCLTVPPKVVTGNLAMGPLYMDNARMREWVFQEFQAGALAMEEVYHACYVNAKPCLMLRSLSDLAGGGKGANEIDTFFQIAADNSAALLLAILKKL
jgi:adenosylhomocysteine nucleosidase